MRLYNTMSRSIEEFNPIVPGKVSMYCCGPTVYNYAHIGNLRTYIFEDLLRRTLRRSGYEVRHVMNITDVGHLSSDADTGEDKMLKGAKREHKTVMEIAQFYTDAFFSDCEKLHIKRPDVVEPATHCISEFIHMIVMRIAYEHNHLELSMIVIKSLKDAYFRCALLLQFDNTSEAFADAKANQIIELMPSIANLAFHQGKQQSPLTLFPRYSQYRQWLSQLQIRKIYRQKCICTHRLYGCNS